MFTVELLWYLLTIFIRCWITGKLSTTLIEASDFHIFISISIESFPGVNIHVLFGDSVRFINIYMSMNTIYDCMSNI